MKKLWSALVIIFMAFLFSGCVGGVFIPTLEPDAKKYVGDYPALFSEAESSLLGVSGGWSAEVVLIDKDDYGRLMFAYYAEGVLSIQVAQKYTEGTVYYYDNVNFLCRDVDEVKREDGKLLVGDIIKNFKEEELEKLKEDNDWDKFYNRKKLFSAKATNEKERLSQQKEAEILKKAGIVKFDNVVSVYLSEDKYGKKIYYIRALSYADTQNFNYQSKIFMCMLDNEGNIIEETGIEEINDKENSQNQLVDFKEKNEWCSFPFSEN